MKIPNIIKSKPFIYSSITVILLIVIFIIIKKVIGKPDAVTASLKQKYSASTSINAGPTATSWETVPRFPLKLGSKNYFVGEIQDALNKYYKAGVKVDNDWGPLTNAAVIKHLGSPEISESQYDTYVAKFKILPRLSVMDEYKKQQEANATVQKDIWSKFINF